MVVTLHSRYLEVHLKGTRETVLTHEHYPGCECSKKLRNECDRRRLDEAFKLYVEQKPGEFEVF